MSNEKSNVNKSDSNHINYSFSDALIKKCALWGIVFFLIGNLMYFLPDIFNPSPPEKSNSEISDIMRDLNYRGESMLLKNIDKNRVRYGYFTMVILIITGLGIVIGMISSAIEYNNVKKGNLKDLDLPKSFTCPNCNTDFELDWLERKAKLFSCPNCEVFFDRRNKYLAEKDNGNILPQIVECPNCREELKLEEEERIEKKFNSREEL